jgi:hypothetical protein
VHHQPDGHLPVDLLDDVIAEALERLGSRSRCFAGRRPLTSGFVVLAA